MNTLKGAIVAIDDTNSQTQVIAFQYNPATIRRSLRPEMVGGEEGDRSQEVRFTGAPVQTITLDIEIDATDQLNAGNPTTEWLGVLPQLATLELLVYPTIQQITNLQSQLAKGVLEVAPLSAPRTLFVWGPNRVMPVRIGEYSITEEIFDPSLRPIRATVALSLRVLNYSDLDASNPSYNDFMAYQQQLQNMSRSFRSADTETSTGVQTEGL